MVFGQLSQLLLQLLLLLFLTEDEASSWLLKGKAWENCSQGFHRQAIDRKFYLFDLFRMSSVMFMNLLWHQMSHAPGRLFLLSFPNWQPVLSHLWWCQWQNRTFAIHFYIDMSEKAPHESVKMFLWHLRGLSKCRSFHYQFVITHL